MQTTAHVTFYRSYYADEHGKKAVLSRLTSYKPSGDDPNELYVGEFVVEIPFAEPTTSEFILHEVATLRRKQADLVKEGTELEERIQSLLCIEAPKVEVVIDGEQI